jgi:hypothetical protein
VASATPTATGGWEYDGELSYHDHGKGMRLKSLCVDLVKFSIDKPEAVFEGEAEVRCSGGTYNVRFVVTVVDSGEPGRADMLQIELPGWCLPEETDEYRAWGTLGGGNIQLHQ